MSWIRGCEPSRRVAAEGIRQGTPVVGLTAPSAARGRLRTYRIRMDYADAVAGAGGVPVVLVPVEGKSGIAAVASRIDALVLTGGGGLPAWYFDEHPRPALEETDPERYRFEAALVGAALGRNLPILGICRGMQMLSEIMGGTRIRNLMLDRPAAGEHYLARSATHRIEIDARSRLAAVVGADRAAVNSRHRQAVDEPGAGLRAVAWAEDGTVEAVEGAAEAAFLAGVQFHPESLAPRDERWLGLFRALLSAALGGGRPPTI